MFEQMNYAELDKVRDALLIEASGMTERDEAKLQVIAEISEEMEYREGVTAKQLLPMVWAINILVLASILYIGLFVCGCQTAKGLTGDAGWILTELSDNITVQEK